jgi:hypothetical protein
MLRVFLQALNIDKNFTLERYFETIQNEFKSFGREVQIVKKDKTKDSHIESAFLKDNTEIYNVEFKTERAVKIKIEVDKNPPLNFKTEFKLLLLPYSFMTRCFTIPGLFAGKMHALLFRNWNTRVKGRDWYDLEWYIQNDYPIDFKHLRERSLQSGYKGNEDFTKVMCMKLLKERIENTKIENVKADVLPFVQDPEQLNIWTKEYFLQLVDRIWFAEEKS